MPQRANGTLVTTLTKKMAEDLTGYLLEHGFRVRYLHLEVDTLERIQIIRDLRLGEYDVLVGVNLLREGLDLPEVSLVAILDADKEGFLRGETSLIQTIGRAARNVRGRVLMYADKETQAMRVAIAETDRRREIQLAYNREHGITPEIGPEDLRDLRVPLDGVSDLAAHAAALPGGSEIASLEDLEKLIVELEEEMLAAADELRSRRRHGSGTSSRNWRAGSREPSGVASSSGFTHSSSTRITNADRIGTATNRPTNPEELTDEDDADRDQRRMELRHAAPSPAG